MTTVIMTKNDEKILAEPPAKVPWRAVCHTFLILIAGSSLLIGGIVGSITDPDTFWPLILLGTLLFIPGSYHTWFAYKANKGHHGWDFDEFPDC